MGQNLFGARKHFWIDDPYNTCYTTGLRDCIITFAENTALYTKASQVFTEADKNGSGELSPDELKVFIKKLTNIDVDKILNPYEQMEMFSDLDEDHDGKLAKKGILKLYQTAQT